MIYLAATLIGLGIGGSSLLSADVRADRGELLICLGWTVVCAVVVVGFIATVGLIENGSL